MAFEVIHYFGNRFSNLSSEKEQEMAPLYRDSKWQSSFLVVHPAALTSSLSSKPLTLNCHLLSLYLSYAAIAGPGRLLLVSSV